MSTSWAVRPSASSGKRNQDAPPHKQTVCETHHLAAAHCAAKDVQPGADKHRAVLVARGGHSAGCGGPLPPTVAVARQAVGVRQRCAAYVATARQQQQAVGARSSGGIHPAGKARTACCDAGRQHNRHSRQAPADEWHDSGNATAAGRQQGSTHRGGGSSPLSGILRHCRVETAGRHRSAQMFCAAAAPAQQCPRHTAYSQPQLAGVQCVPMCPPGTASRWCPAPSCPPASACRHCRPPPPGSGWPPAPACGRTAPRGPAPPPSPCGSARMSA